MLEFLSCSYCNRVRCDSNGGDIQVRLLNNGENAVFGPNAFVHRDSIRYFALADPQYKLSIGFIDEEQVLGLSLNADVDYILEIKGIRSDTFSLTSTVTAMSECCKSYEVTSVSRNGEIFCTGICDGILNIEI